MLAAKLNSNSIWTFQFKNSRGRLTTARAHFECVKCNENYELNLNQKLNLIQKLNRKKKNGKVKAKWNFTNQIVHALLSNTFSVKRADSWPNEMKHTRKFKLKLKYGKLQTCVLFLLPFVAAGSVFVAGCDIWRPARVIFSVFHPLPPSRLLPHRHSLVMTVTTLIRQHHIQLQAHS